MPTTPTKRVAVIDLGSNSFHLIIAEKQQTSLRYIDHWKEPVRVADGIKPDGTISIRKQKEALTVLESFRQHLEDYPVDSARVIATSAFRKARNSGEFVRKAETSLGLPIEVISGREEARLIFRGVAGMGSSDTERCRLILDIGGGSTEIILGSNDLATHLVSLEYGNISLHRKIFTQRKLSRKLFIKARSEIIEQIGNSELGANNLRWNTAIGASGTFRLLEYLLRKLGLAENGITGSGLADLVEILLGEVDKRSTLLEVVPEERRATFPAALAIVQALFEFFHVNHLHVTELGIRDGVLAELAELPLTRDRDHASLHQMMEFYGVDKEKARQVKKTAMHLFSFVTNVIPYEPGIAERLLGGAAHIYEIGKALHIRGYHKHGAYILLNSQMPGFTKIEQGQMAFLVLNHRKRLKTTHPFAQYPVDWGLVGVFRLACHLVNQSLTLPKDSVSLVRWKRNTFSVKLDKDLLTNNPILRTNLEKETEYWAELGMKYVVDC